MPQTPFDEVLKGMFGDEAVPARVRSRYSEIFQKFHALQASAGRASDADPRDFIQHRLDSADATDEEKVWLNDIRSRLRNSTR